MSLAVPLKSIQAFEAAARLGSFAAAAAELHLTPSAISHQIRFLEEKLGVSLFHRIHRGIVLTDAGRHYAESVTRGLGIIDTATHHMQHHGKQDVLTIHCAPSFASQWLMPKLSRFSAAYPDIGIRINASVGPVDLATEAADFDVRYGPIFPESGVIAVPFPKEPLAVMCSPSLANGEHPIRTVQDLRHHSLIQSEFNLITWKDWFRQHRLAEADMRFGPRFDRSFMAISAAVDGTGVILDSRLQVEREIASGKLVLPLGTEPAVLVFHRLLYLQSKAHLPKMVAFKDWLFDELGKSFKALKNAGKKSIPASAS